MHRSIKEEVEEGWRNTQIKGGRGLISVEEGSKKKPKAKKIEQSMAKSSLAGWSIC